jgi:TolB protein
MAAPQPPVYPIALPMALGETDLAAGAIEVERRDLDLVGAFRIVDPASYSVALVKEGLGFSAKLWSQLKTQLVAKLRVVRLGASLVLDGRLYQVGHGRAAVLTKTYQGTELRTLVHKWSNDVIDKVTGMSGVFGSRIAFAMMDRTPEIATIGMDGLDLNVLTTMKSRCFLPAYSPTGDQIAFNSYLSGGADLWLVPDKGGRAHLISHRNGLNTAAAWFPGGEYLVATLSFEGNAELYKLAASDGTVVSRLTDEPSIDSSASVSPDGDQIAFISDREGSPQVYLMPSSGGAARRLTNQGTFSQSPHFCPRKETSIIAFAARDEPMVFDIFLYDLHTGKVERVTQGQGSNFDPSWSPDCRQLVYASSRQGLFVMNLQTHREFQIYEGGAQNPSWGPMPTESR